MYDGELCVQILKLLKLKPSVNAGLKKLWSCKRNSDSKPTRQSIKDVNNVKYLQYTDGKNGIVIPFSSSLRSTALLK